MNASQSERKSDAHNPLTRRILLLTLYLFVGSLLALSGASSVWAGGNRDAGSEYQAEDLGTARHIFHESRQGCHTQTSTHAK